PECALDASSGASRRRLGGHSDERTAERTWPAPGAAVVGLRECPDFTDTSPLTRGLQVQDLAARGRCRPAGGAAPDTPLDRAARPTKCRRNRRTETPRPVPPSTS